MSESESMLEPVDDAMNRASDDALDLASSEVPHITSVNEPDIDRPGTLVQPALDALDVAPPAIPETPSIDGLDVDRPATLVQPALGALDLEPPAEITEIPDVPEVPEIPPLEALDLEPEMPPVPPVPGADVAMPQAPGKSSARPAAGKPSEAAAPPASKPERKPEPKPRPKPAAKTSHSMPKSGATQPKPEPSLKPSDRFAQEHEEKTHDGGFEVYDYPGEFLSIPDQIGEKERAEYIRDRGARYARIRIEELQTREEQIHAQTNARGLNIGALFSLTDHPRYEGGSDKAPEFLLTAANYHFRLNAFESGAARSSETEYACSFSVIDARRTHRPRPLTPKPTIAGPQTAIVVGRKDEEIWTDKYGRVKVQFHWDRYGKHDENSSCWVRVAQAWAGKGWGSIHIPRIGQEVIVEFLEGDPDQPIITGRVYNGGSMPPYDLPANKTQSGLKSRSSKGASANNFNELRFEDLKGSEEVYMQAEKDLRVHVKDAETETVGSNITTNAGASISRSAGKDISRTANENIKDTAGQNIVTYSGKNMNLKAGGSYELWTNLGIHLKAMNFIAELIESGAKQAAKAIKKGYAKSAVAAGSAAIQASPDGKKAAGAAALDTGQQGVASTGMHALAALAPGIEAGAAELNRLSDQAASRTDKLNEPVNKTIESADKLGKAIEAGESPEAIAAAFMTMADAAASAFKDAEELVNGLLPQIPSIVLWAMKDINAKALWSMSLKTHVKDITIQAMNKDVHVKAKQNINVEAQEKDLNLKASKQTVNLTGEQDVNLRAVNGELTVETDEKSGKRLSIKSPKQIVLQCGDSCIMMNSKGTITIKGKKIKINSTSGGTTVQGKTINLN